MRVRALSLVVVVLWLVACGGAREAPVVPAATGAGAAAPTLILISLDGFRWDYLDWEEASNLRQLAEEGVRGEGVIPAFPSKTFPCHYSIVTGLYPGHNGIVSNNMYDPEIGGEFHLNDRSAVEDARWWGGEPIWVTAEKQGLIAAAMFWPGTEAEIAGYRPSHWHSYDKSFTFEARVAQVLEWLDLPRAERPRLITLYFEYPNDVSHSYGPEAPETRDAIRTVDERIRDLVDGLAERGLEGEVNLVITADHGMAEVDRERLIILDDYFDFEAGEVFEAGAFVQIFPNPGREDAIYAALVDAHPQLAVYRRHEIPERFHLRDSERAAPIIATPAVGWETATETMLARWGGRMLKGDHGQDPADPRMHAVFVAHGPSFERGITIGRFEGVEIYNLLAAVLDLEPAPNDGDPATLAGILRK